MVGNATPRAEGVEDDDVFERMAATGEFPSVGLQRAPGDDGIVPDSPPPGRLVRT